MCEIYCNNSLLHFILAHKTTQQSECLNDFKVGMVYSRRY